VVLAGGPNFAVLMLPKLRADVLPFATVSYDQLRQWASRESQKRFREAERRLERGDPGGATVLLQEILASTPSVGVLDLLGLLHLRQGRPQEGRQMLEQAIARDPKYLFPYSHLAVHLLAEGRHGDAAAVARQALAVDGDGPPAT
jgi:Flp pilus assembly protein TadD